MWGSCRTIPLVDGFYRDSSVSPALVVSGTGVPLTSWARHNWSTDSAPSRSRGPAHLPTRKAVLSRRALRHRPTRGLTAEVVSPNSPQESAVIETLLFKTLLVGNSGNHLRQTDAHVTMTRLHDDAVTPRAGSVLDLSSWNVVGGPWLQVERQSAARISTQGRPIIAADRESWSRLISSRAARARQQSVPRLHAEMPGRRRLMKASCAPAYVNISPTRSQQPVVYRVVETRRSGTCTILSHHGSFPSRLTAVGPQHQPLIRLQDELRHFEGAWQQVFKRRWEHISPFTVTSNLSEVMLKTDSILILLVGGFSRGSPVSSPLHSGVFPYLPRFTIIGSQDLAVKSLNTLPRWHVASTRRGDAATRVDKGGDDLGTDDASSGLSEVVIGADIAQLEGLGARRASSRTALQRTAPADGSHEALQGSKCLSRTFTGAPIGGVQVSVTRSGISRLGNIASPRSPLPSTLASGATPAAENVTVQRQGAFRASYRAPFRCVGLESSALTNSTRLVRHRLGCGTLWVRIPGKAWVLIESSVLRPAARGGDSPGVHALTLTPVLSSRPEQCTNCSSLTPAPPRSPLHALLYSYNCRIGTALRRREKGPPPRGAKGASTTTFKLDFTLDKMNLFLKPTGLPKGAVNHESSKVIWTAKATEGVGQFRHGVALISCVPKGDLGGVVARLFISHQGEPGSIPGGVAAAFFQVGIVPDCTAGRRVFSEISQMLAALNIEVLRADEGEVRYVCSSAEIKKKGATGGPRENSQTSGIDIHDSHLRKSGSGPATGPDRLAFADLLSPLVETSTSRNTTPLARGRAHVASYTYFWTAQRSLTLLLPAYHWLRVKRGVSEELASNQNVGENNKRLESTSPPNEFPKYSWLYQ
ncbi:hypothetical protein PR048_003406 [Dryococelus australis]|uniref:Uncharacterized protein n=1 Tax=Dryococelus australis TaxID=614101 RepID=A0ABQ9IN19_9NEOP|nr:hypothetical protein PR048_003406 [Dryococelus australis]